MPHLTQPPFTTDLVSGGQASKAPFANNPAIKTQPRAGNGVDHLLHFCFQKHSVFGLLFVYQQKRGALQKQISLGVSSKKCVSDDLL